MKVLYLNGVAAKLTQTTEQEAAGAAVERGLLPSRRRHRFTSGWGGNGSNMGAPIYGAATATRGVREFSSPVQARGFRWKRTQPRYSTMRGTWRAWSWYFGTFRAARRRMRRTAPTRNNSARWRIPSRSWPGWRRRTETCSGITTVGINTHRQERGGDARPRMGVGCRSGDSARSSAALAGLWNPGPFSTWSFRCCSADGQYRRF